MSLTPMMQQYLSMHERVPDTIMLFRVGDFYETFFDDAITASKVLEIALTGKQCGLDEPAPMCGVPHHAAEPYIAKLVEKGYKVSVCEQMEDPAAAKGIVKRDIIKVVSPGTITDSSNLSEKKNNYLVAIFGGRHSVGLAYVDISTGEFRTTDIDSNNDYAALINELGKIEPSEIIASPAFYKQSDVIQGLEQRFNCMITLVDNDHFDLKKSEMIVEEQFRVFALDALGLKGHDEAVRASGALLTYIDDTQMKVLGHINHLNYYRTEDYMLLDLATRRNLELTETLRRGEKRGSLLWVLDKTTTAMGGRLLRSWIEAPLIDKNKIEERQTLVSELVQNPGGLADLKALLSKVYDLERICGKLSFGTISPKDMLSLKQSVAMLPKIAECISTFDAPKLKEIYEDADLLTDIYDLIDAGIADDAPFVLRDGGVIKAGYSAEIDETRQASTNGKEWIKNLEAAERKRTGIKSLKVKYNKVFGYFIEVSKPNLDRVPDDYVRKQTLTNAERFFTPELKDMETKILGSEERLNRLEYELFADIRKQIMAQMTRIQKRARDLAALDVYYSLAVVAVERHYSCPKMTEGGVISIKNGRHPVAEALMDPGMFVANDCLLDRDTNRMMLITGPNMAGKSTYIRQVAIITLMAQIGSFVPADEAEIGVVDRIFTRIGASDDLTTGQSTFMVEMSEVSNILKNATSHSLVILDEIGRGTSTFDGISIAWAVVEYLSNPLTVGAKTLFATHYHELTELEKIKTGIKNYSIGLKETKDGVIFLRKVKRGPADQSYGIEVAELAGFPKIVTARAKDILKELERGELTYREGMLDAERAAEPDNQISFYSQIVESSKKEPLDDAQREVLESLEDLEINRITPIEAMNTLDAFKKKLDGEKAKDDAS